MLGLRSGCRSGMRICMWRLIRDRSFGGRSMRSGFIVVGRGVENLHFSFV